MRHKSEVEPQSDRPEPIRAQLLARSCRLLLSEMRYHVTKLREIVSECLTSRPSTSAIDMVLSRTYETTTRLWYLIGVLTELNGSSGDTEAQPSLGALLRTVVGSGNLTLDLEQGVVKELDNGDGRWVVVALLVHAITRSGSVPTSFSVFGKIVDGQCRLDVAAGTETETAELVDPDTMSAALSEMIEAVGGTLLSDGEWRWELTLPVTGVAQTAARVTNPAAAARTVLLIEDDPLLRNAVRSWMIKVGFEVLEADNSDTAIEMFEAHKQTIDFVMQDLVLPGARTGVELLQELLSRRADLPVIIASGAIDAGDADQLYALGAKAYLSKPYKMEQLMALIDGME
ncbi:MAG TPA: hypothetical protein DIT01_08535 [Lentisphaeria bacterium]|nr:hypothetical protein [Lentisphaeria bacterium]|tara:strand:+ start:1585 stop:2616 length:1032 start_codon:yes stop_codon:yes gene_type:complete